MKNKKTNIFVMIILALLILSPLDPIPDFIPFLGWLDDVLYALGIIAGAVNMIRNRRTNPEVVIDAQQWDDGRQ